MRTDLLELETTLRNKMEAEGHSTQTVEEKKDQQASLELMKLSMQEQNAQREEEDKEAEDRKKAAKGDDPGYCSSGLESDNDLDLLVEQEALRSNRMRARPKKYAERGEVPTKDSE